MSGLRVQFDSQPLLHKIYSQKVLPQNLSSLGKSTQLIDHIKQMSMEEVQQFEKEALSILHPSIREDIKKGLVDRKAQLIQHDRFATPIPAQVHATTKGKKIEYGDQRFERLSRDLSVRNEVEEKAGIQRVEHETDTDSDFSTLSDKGKERAQKYSPSVQFQARLGASISGLVVRIPGMHRNKSSIFRQPVVSGGLLASMQEIEVVGKALEKIDGSKNFTPAEKEKIKIYYENLKRSQDLNYAIGALKEITDSQEAEKGAETIGAKIVAGVAKLHEGDSLTLDFGVLQHAMRLSVKKENGKFIIRLYDSGGHVDITDRAKTKWGMFKIGLGGIFKKGITSSRTALEIVIPEEKLYREGKQYFKNLFIGHSGAARMPEKERIEAFANKYRQDHRIIAKLMPKVPGLMAKLSKYQNLMARFSSIAEVSDPPHFVPLLQTPQVNNNCYAKKVQTTQLQELGKPLFKKLYAYCLEEHREAVLQIMQSGLKTEDTQRLASQSSGILSPDELRRTVTMVGKLPKIPSPEYFEEVFGKKSDILKKYEALYSGKFHSAPTSTRQLAEWAAFESCSCILRLFDHGVCKVQAHGRYVTSQADRCPKASLRKALKFGTQADVESAHTVNIVKSDTKTKKYKIEININGQQREIDISTYLTLVSKFEGTLDHPATMEMLQLIQFDKRSKAVQIIAEKIYPKQIDIIRKKQTELIQQQKGVLEQQKTKYDDKLSDIHSQLKKLRKKEPSTKLEEIHIQAAITQLEICQDCVEMLLRLVKSDLQESAMLHAKAESFNQQVTTIISNISEFQSDYLQIKDKINEYQYHTEQYTRLFEDMLMTTQGHLKKLAKGIKI